MLQVVATGVEEKEEGFSGFYTECLWAMIATFQMYMLSPSSRSKYIFSSDKLLMVLASTLILDSGSLRTHDYIFLSHDSESWNDLLAILV